MDLEEVEVIFEALWLFLEITERRIFEWQTRLVKVVRRYFEAPSV